MVFGYCEATVKISESNQPGQTDKYANQERESIMRIQRQIFPDDFTQLANYVTKIDGQVTRNNNNNFEYRISARLCNKNQSIDRLRLNEFLFVL